MIDQISHSRLTFTVLLTQLGSFFTMFPSTILHPPSPLMNSPDTKSNQSINYQLSAHCWVLSHSGTRARQTVSGRSFLRDQKQIRVTPCEKAPGYAERCMSDTWHTKSRMDQDTMKKVTVSQIMLLSCSAWWAYAEHTEAVWPWVVLLMGDRASEQNTCLSITCTPKHGTSQHRYGRLHRNTVSEQVELLTYWLD